MTAYDEFMALRYSARPDLPTDHRASTDLYPHDIFIPKHGADHAESWQDRETGETQLLYPAAWDLVFVSKD